MTDVQTTERPAKRGLSRRDMIKGAAVAGAAAWTAPVIIDSLTSPAAAFSGPCTKYAVKLNPSTSTTAAAPTSYAACFGGTTSTCFDASDARWAGSQATPTFSCGSGSLNLCSNNNCDGTGGGPVFCPTSSGASNKLSSMSLSRVTVGSTLYQKLVITGGCGFNSATTWQIGGRYPPGSPGSTFVRVTTVCPSSAGPDGTTPNGCYWPATNTAWVVDSVSGNSANYVYVKFCCAS